MSEEQPVNDNVIVVDFTRTRTPKAMKAAATTQVAAEVTAPDSRLTKAAVFKAMIDDAMVMVRVNTAAAGLVIPEALKSKPVQALNFSRKFGIADFAHDAQGVRATLSFGGVNVFCDVPWSAVFAMHGHKTQDEVVWPYSMPMVKETA